MITVEEWQPADGLTLEPNAKRAAKARKRCLALTAGPGAGKTEMLAQRADFLCEQERVDTPKGFWRSHLRLMPAETLQSALNAGVEGSSLLALTVLPFTHLPSAS